MSRARVILPTLAAALLGASALISGAGAADHPGQPDQSGLHQGAAEHPAGRERGLQGTLAVLRGGLRGAGVGVHEVVVVVSAMGDSTDELLDLAEQVSPLPPARELDMLLTAVLDSDENDVLLRQRLDECTGLAYAYATLGQ